MGPREDTASTAYLRPETAQAIFLNFSNVQESMRKKIPFGIAQIGKAFRNEITPGNFIFRSREFEQMEMQFFIRPGTQKENMDLWRERRMNWHINNGIKKENLRWFEHPQDKLAHYADMAFDIEYQFPFGFSELEGIHSRTDFDLREHQKFSGKSLLYHDPINNEKFLPYVIETSAGLDRTILSLLCDAYTEEPERVVLKLKPSLAPIKLAVLPLMKKEELENPALKIFEDLSKSFKIEYDASGSIGKRYRRHDEIGTPYAVTVDYDSLKDQTVTVRERDSMQQTRMAMDNIAKFLRDNL